MSKVEAYKKLIRQFYSGTINEGAKQNFQHYLEDPEFLEAWEELLFDEQQEEIKIEEPSSDTLFEKIKADSRVRTDIHQPPIILKPRKFNSNQIAAAAILLLLGVSSLFFWIQNATDSHLDNLNQTISKSAHILPGSQKAQIILENGNRIDLEKIKGDTIIDNGNFDILKSADGTISYRLKDNGNQRKALAFNTIVTPRGGEYMLHLQDGTKVWLNAMTTIKYPIFFSKNKREIEIKGEAYFEVAKQEYEGKRVPFVIHAGHQDLEVLGTAFNLQHYGDNIITTLVEGKVKLNFKNSQLPAQYLTPEDQSIFNTATQQFSKKKVDPSYYSAWKDGKFAFEKTPIEDVMKCIERWYDVEVVFKEQLHDVQFSGTISRYEDLKKLLQTIELVGDIRFELKGRRIYVMQ
jgi:hypothetical protein